LLPSLARKASISEPWLTQGKTVEHGHLLTDSSQKPGLIGDCLVTTASVFEQRKAEFQAIARGRGDAECSMIEAHAKQHADHQQSTVAPALLTQHERAAEQRNEDGERNRLLLDGQRRCREKSIGHSYRRWAVRVS
jgi:hypothetical protein